MVDCISLVCIREQDNIRSTSLFGEFCSFCVCEEKETNFMLLRVDDLPFFRVKEIVVAGESDGTDNKQGGGDDGHDEDRHKSEGLPPLGL